MICGSRPLPIVSSRLLPKLPKRLKWRLRLGCGAPSQGPVHRHPRRCAVTICSLNARQTGVKQASAILGLPERCPKCLAHGRGQAANCAHAREGDRGRRMGMGRPPPSRCTVTQLSPAPATGRRTQAFARASALDQTPAWVWSSPGPPAWCRAGCARRWRSWRCSRGRSTQRRVCGHRGAGAARRFRSDRCRRSALKRVVVNATRALLGPQTDRLSVAAIIRTHWRRPRTIWIAVIAGAAPPIISARPRLRFRSDDSAGRGANCCASDRAGSAA
jgi:hypothetical protein